MNYVMQLEEENGILSVTAEGNWEPGTDNVMVDEIMKAVVSHGVRKILLDISRLRYDLSIVQIFERAKELRDKRMQQERVSSKVALVYPSDSSKLEEDMQFFETASQNRNLPYRVFKDAADAREWLLLD